MNINQKLLKHIDKFHNVYKEGEEYLPVPLCEPVTVIYEYHSGEITILTDVLVKRLDIDVSNITKWLTQKDVDRFLETDSWDKQYKNTLPSFCGGFDKNGVPLCYGDIIKLHVRRVCTSPWWGQTSTNDGHHEDYFIFKRIVRKLDPHGFFCVKLKPLEEVSERQKQRLISVKGSEKYERTIDDINYRLEHIEIL